MSKIENSKNKKNKHDITGIDEKGVEAEKNILLEKRKMIIGLS